MKAEFTCQGCGHEFDRIGEEAPQGCPRCGCEELEHNPYLFGSADAEPTPDDYFDSLLTPCCQPGWRGWCRQYQASLPLPEKDKEI